MKVPKLWIVVVWVFVLNKSLNAQFFSKTYHANLGDQSYVYQVLPFEAGMLGNLEQTCSDSLLCDNILVLDTNGDLKYTIEHRDYYGFYNNMFVRNDTVFTADYEFNAKDSFYYWKVLMTDVSGAFIQEYKYRIQHAKEVFISGGYVYPKLYGLLVNQSEIFLWGEGLDKGANGNWMSAIRPMFLRIGLDGIANNPYFYFKNIYDRQSISDCAIDADGNPVFSLEYYGGNQSYSKDIYKILSEDSIALLAHHRHSASNSGRSCLITDKMGNYYYNHKIDEGTLEGYGIASRLLVYVSKVNKDGEKLWDRPIYPPAITNWDSTYTVNYALTRMALASNGDILCSGYLEVFDYLYNRVSGKIQKMTGVCSFIARLNSDGNMLWRHIIVPYRNDGKIRDNYILDIKEDSDGSIVVGGEIQRLEGDDKNWTSDAWVMRLNDRGCMTDDCNHVGKYWNFPWDITAVEDDENLALDGWSISPNPGANFLKLEVTSDVLFPISYAIFSSSGGQLAAGRIEGSRALMINTDYFHSGIYFIQFSDKMGNTVFKKWVKN